MKERDRTTILSSSSPSYHYSPITVNNSTNKTRIDFRSIRPRSSSFDLPTPELRPVWSQRETAATSITSLIRRGTSLQ